MKKKLLYSLMASLSMISVGAYAEPVTDDSTAALTTKGYVDAGLKYVYDSIQSDVGDIQGDITNLQNTVGAPASGGNAATGLVGDVAGLQDAIGTAGVGNTPGTGLTGDVEALQDALDDGNGNLIDVSQLKDTVGDDSSGLVKRVNELEAASQEYIEGTGIDISQNAQGKNVVSLDLGTTQNNTTYVFKTDANGNGTWQAMEVEDSWSPTAFENNVLGN